MIRTINYNFDAQKSSSSYKLIIPSSSLVKNRQYIGRKSPLYRLFWFLILMIIVTIILIVWYQIEQSQKQQNLLWKTLQSLTSVENNINNIDRINQQLSDDIDIIRKQVRLFKHLINDHNQTQTSNSISNST